MAKTLIYIGIFCIAAGVLWMLLDQLGLGRFIGHLPGDINFTRGNMTVHFPIITCIIASIVLTLVLNIFFRR